MGARQGEEEARQPGSHALCRQTGNWADRQTRAEGRTGSAVARGGGGGGEVRVRHYLIYAPHCL